jgi:hypothetical protein
MSRRDPVRLNGRFLCPELASAQKSRVDVSSIALRAPRAMLRIEESHQFR